MNNGVYYNLRASFQVTVRPFDGASVEFNFTPKYSNSHVRKFNKAIETFEPGREIPAYTSPGQEQPERERQQDHREPAARDRPLQQDLRQPRDRRPGRLRADRQQDPRHGDPPRRLPAHQLPRDECRFDREHEQLGRRERMGAAVVVRTHQLRLQIALPVRSQRPRRRLVAFRPRPPFRHVSLGIGGLAPLGRGVPQRGAVDFEPQAARLVGPAGQPADRNLPRLHHHHARPELHLRRQTGRRRRAEILRQRRHHVGDHRDDRRGSRRGAVRQQAERDVRLLQPQDQGHPAHPAAPPASRA